MMYTYRMLPPPPLPPPNSFYNRVENSFAAIAVKCQNSLHLPSRHVSTPLSFSSKKPEDFPSPASQLPYFSTQLSEMSDISSPFSWVPPAPNIQNYLPLSQEKKKNAFIVKSRPSDNSEVARFFLLALKALNIFFS